METQHTYDAAGNYTVALTVTDEGGRTGDATASLALTNASGEGDAGPFIEDPAGDGGTSQGDLLAVNVTNNATHLTFNVTFRATQSGATTHSVWMPSVYLNDNRYEPFFCLGDGAVYGYEEEDSLDGASVEVDGDSQTWVVVIPRDGIAAEAPYEVFVESRIGEPCLLGGGRVTDRAPDEGTKTYAPT